jgi:hypothetical protein
MPRTILDRLRKKVDHHRRTTQFLIEDMCKIRQILMNDGYPEEAASVEQACARMAEIEKVFDNVDTCLL